MNTTKRANSKAVPGKTTDDAGNSKTTGVVVAILIALVVAAIVAAIALGNGSEAADTSAADSARIPTSGVVRQVSFAATSADLPPFDAAIQDPAVGLQAPSFTASYFDNQEVVFELDDGQPRVLMFMAHWCSHCQAEVDALADYFATSGVRSDVQLVPISTSVDEGAPNHPPSRWLINESWPVPVLRDSQSNNLARGFGLSGFPFYVVVNGDGEIVARRSGAVSTSQWDNFLDLALTASPAS